MDTIQSGDEWFKFHLSWTRALNKLSAQEAGRFIQTLVRYAIERGPEEEYVLSGKEDVLLSVAIGDLEKDANHRAVIAQDKLTRSQKAKESAMARWHGGKTNAGSTAAQENGTQSGEGETCPDMRTHATACERMRPHANAGKNKKEEKEKRSKKEEIDPHMRETAAGGGEVAPSALFTPQASQTPPAFPSSSPHRQKGMEQMFSQRPDVELDSDVPQWLRDHIEQEH